MLTLEIDVLSQGPLACCQGDYLAVRPSLNSDRAHGLLSFTTTRYHISPMATEQTPSHDTGHNMGLKAPAKPTK